MCEDTVGRFRNPAGNDSKDRPGYPTSVLALLKKKCALTPESVVADVGSGTGILSELFLKNGNLVYGIEPNKEMRAAPPPPLPPPPPPRSPHAPPPPPPLHHPTAPFVAAGHAF